MLLASFSKAILCVLVCFLLIENGSLQSISRETDYQIIDIAEDIKTFRFGFAEDQILKLKDNSKIAEVIHEVYANPGGEDPVDLIFKFNNALTRVDVAFHVLKALRNEMVEHSNFDPLKLVPLAKAFVLDVIHQKNNDEIIKAESIKISEELKKDVQKSATDILTSAMLSNNYILNATVERVAREIFNFYYSVSNAVMREMVNRTYSIVPALQIIDNVMSSSEFMSQKASMLLALFEKLEKDKDFDNDAILAIASSIKKLRADDNYLNLFPYLKYDINVMVDKLPTCARNLYLVEEVCIWNRGKEEYLFASSPSRRDVNQTIVYTGAGEALKGGEGGWTIETFFDSILFNSQANKKQYLSFSRQTFNRVAHFAQTSVRDVENLDETTLWKVELLGEYCLIKNQNIEFDEYLFVTNLRDSERERNVFSTTATATNINPINFQWQIKDCS